ncbi:MAG: polyphosphate kinase 1 [Bacteroidota bacterium]
MASSKYVKRDISWLSFNARVLQEAKDDRVPLYERIKFLAIYSSNLDEFFRVRVASLRSFKKLKKDTRSQFVKDVKPKKELKEIRKIVQKQQTEFGLTFRDSILPQLRQNNIFLISELSYSKEQKEFVKQYFKDNIKPVLKAPIFFDENETTPFLLNKALYLVVQLKNTGKLALVEIPSDDCPRFIVFPSANGQTYITFLDDLLRYHLNDIIGEEVLNAYSIKISRDAELYIDDNYDGDLIEKLKASLGERNIGLPTRFLYDSSMSAELTLRLKKLFELSKDDMVPGARYHNFNDFFGFPEPSENPEYRDQPLPPREHPIFENASSTISLLQERDVMLHFPYQQYKYVPEFILQAADDPQVESIKITLYRVASKSAVVTALLEALKKGKKVMAFIEAKARFDEASNLYWGGELQKAGGKVMYSDAKIKVHSKLLLVQRREEEKLKNYAYLGTGNFNEKTAKLYCDHALMTSNPKLTDEVSMLFEHLEDKSKPLDCNHLFVSPYTTRDKFVELINNEITNALMGKEAYMILKMNSLEDTKMIKHLYRASQAGVKIRLIVRGICCCIPGIEGMSENIEITSIVDRFLEHARVYIFCNDGNEIMYTASADWMTRNLDRRIEVVIPILDPTIYEELRHIINIQLSDNTKARIIDPDQINQYVVPEPGADLVRAQEATYQFLLNKYHTEEVRGLEK